MDLRALRDHHARRIQLGSLGIFAIGGVLALGLLVPAAKEFFRTPDEYMRPSMPKVAMFVFLAFVVIGGCALAVRSMRRNTVVANALLDHPERIAWVYGIQQTTNGIPTAQPVMLCGLDGTSARLAARRQDDVLRCLAREIPDLIVGYGKAQGTQYRAAVAAYQARARPA